MAELNELFEQILHSERNFKERTTRLKELSSKIQQCQLELQQTKEVSHTLQGELVVKRLKLADLEVNAKLLAIRRGIAQEQRDTLAENRKQVINELPTELQVTGAGRKRLNEATSYINEAAEKVLDTQRETYRDELIEFGRGYDLCGLGCKHREEQAKRMLNVLQDELILLEAELVEMDSQKEEVKKLEEQLAKARAQLQQERAREEDLQKVMTEQKAEIKQLEEDKGGLKEKLSRDPEFVRLQHELEACKDCPEELSCQTLTRELEELQRQCYHKNMKQQLSLRRRGCSSSDSGNGSGSSSSGHDSGGVGGGGTRRKCGATSLHQRAGHYNPYTCQYVPAPSACESDARDSFTAQASSRLSREGEESLSPDDQSQGSADSAEGMSLVDSEWLEGEDDAVCDDRNDCSGGDVQDWDIDLDESELASLESDINLTPGDTEVDSVGCNEGDEDSSFLRIKRPRKTATTLNASSLSGQSAVRANASSVTHLMTTRAKHASAQNGFSAHATGITEDAGLSQTASYQRRGKQPQTNLARRTQSLFGFSHKPTRRGPTPKPDVTSSNSPAQGGSATKRQISESSLVKTSVGSSSSSKSSDFSVSAIDSPVPGHATRKRPGQSIYKAPGQQQHNLGCLPKSAKKVRFHY